MAQPVFYQTLSMVGVDPTLYFAVSASATPETPAPPFLNGTQAFGSDGSQFVFVQASTSISLTDFVILTNGATVGYQANSITNTNVASSIAVGIGSAGLVLKQSVTFIPAAAYFWALTRGQYVPATNSNGLAANAGTGGVLLYTSATAGVLTSVTTSSSLAGALAGIITINSLTVSIPSSIVPPAGGTQSNGYTVGPVVNMNLPRGSPNITAIVATIAPATVGVEIYSF